MSVEQATLATPPSSNYGVTLWVLIALFLVGLGSLVYGLTSESAQVDFDLLAASYLYLLGVSQAGVVFIAMTRLVKAQWAKPYYRLAELSTLAFAPFAIAGFLLLYFGGKDEFFYWLNPPAGEHLSPFLNINWLFIRDLVSLLVFYALAAVYCLKGLKLDLGTSQADHRKVEGELYVFSPIVILGFVLCNTFFAWDFAMMIIPHWHSTVFPIFYWFGNIFAASAGMIVFPALLGLAPAGGSPFTLDQVRYLGMMVTAFTLIWLYLFWAQFFVIWFGNMPHEFEPLWRQMYGHYGPFFWTMMAGCFFVPFIAFIFAIVKRSLLAMCVIAFGINLGIWLSKYLMVVPVFSPDDRPFDSWLDITLAAGLLAGFLASIIVLATRLPMYARWEMALKPIPRTD